MAVKNFASSKRIKRKNSEPAKFSKEQVKFYICSKCKSTNVRYVFEFGNIFGILPKMKCGSCKTKGLFPLIVMDKDKLNAKNFASLKEKKNGKPAKFFKMKARKR